jgi:hypothetical protein
MFCDWQIFWMQHNAKPLVSDADLAAAITQDAILRFKVYFETGIESVLGEYIL